jgi:two-component system, chemotaxis family, response regulator WspF
MMPIRIAIAHHDVSSMKIMRQFIAQEQGYMVVWTTYSAGEVLPKCRHNRPDILLLDLALAGMGGATLICDIMKDAPCAILVLSDAIDRQAGKVFEAMGCGALDVIATPVIRKNGPAEGGDALFKKLATMAKLLGGLSHGAQPSGPQSPSQSGRLPPLLAIGSSTGGPKALATILSSFPEGLEAAVVICQHVDLQFARGLAEWLDSQTPLTVEIAEEGARPRSGLVLVAGTNDHLVLTQDLTFHYTADPLDYPYRPSVNAMFESVLKYWPRKDLAILLTGMGRDGAEGLSALRRAGWHTIVQDEKTSIVYGMPAAAVELGGAVEILPLERIAEAILSKIPINKGITQ